MKLGKIAIAFCLVTGVRSLGANASDPAQPDVFLVTIDTLRADHVHCYGYDRIQTPALDSLAHDGIRFTHAFTPSPLTNTSHTSILTGLQPSPHGVTDFGVPLSTNHATLAALLQEKGYHTAAFIGAVILDSNALAPGLDQGFEFYDNFPQNPPTKTRWGRLERRGMDVVQDAENWLDKNPSHPAFVWVHLYDPHDPYEPPPPFSEIYKQNLYDGEIAYADAALANLVSYLKLRQRYGPALIIVVGDHGEGLGEHHEDTHGIFLYDSTLHVPLLIKLPGSTNPGSASNGRQGRNPRPAIMACFKAVGRTGVSGGRAFFCHGASQNCTCGASWRSRHSTRRGDGSAKAGIACAGPRSVQGQPEACARAVFRASTAG